MRETNDVPSVIEDGKSRRAASAEAYVNEPVRFAPLQVVNLTSEAAAVSEAYRNQVITRVNGSCLRLAVFNDVFEWHQHPTSDELFLVVEGTLVIDIKGGAELRLGPWQRPGRGHWSSSASTARRLIEEGRAASAAYLPP